MKQRTTTLFFLTAIGLLATNGHTGPHETDIVFPHVWVGDIDKADFNEPSGICWHSLRGTLFVVGDEGDICEIETDGTLVKAKRLRKADFEGVTHDPATGLLYIAVEGEEIVLEVDPETFEVLREFEIPRTLNGRTLMKAKGQGIEAITFVPDPEHPQGGIFLVANQAFELTNEEDISAVFLVELPLRSGNTEPQVMGYFSPGIIDLSGLHFDTRSGRLYVVSDATNTIHVYSGELDFIESFALPGENQEGITADDAGFFYIAQDSGGIVKLKHPVGD